MFFKKKSSAINGRVEAPKSAKQLQHAYLVREAWWLGLVLVGVYLAVIFISYNSQDPSWSHLASENAVIHNAGGAVGAWVSDMLLYLFGFSAWWWVVLAFYSIWLVYWRLELTLSERPFLIFNLVGFALLLLASSALEAGHLVSLPASLPLDAGGMLGNAVDHVLRSMFGYAGSTMLLLLLFAVGFSLFTGWSWIMMTEKLGAMVISSYEWVWNQYHDWQDKKAGKVVEQARTEFVAQE
ncbi:MAG: DNA translocase FtsK 4TM domain-containing protein, partial [Methylophilaceae bacterium]